MFWSTNATSTAKHRSHRGKILNPGCQSVHRTVLGCKKPIQCDAGQALMGNPATVGFADGARECEAIQLHQSVGRFTTQRPEEYGEHVRNILTDQHLAYDIGTERNNEAGDPHTPRQMLLNRRTEKHGNVGQPGIGGILRPRMPTRTIGRPQFFFPESAFLSPMCLGIRMAGPFGSGSR